MNIIRSKDNAQVKAWSKLAADARERDRRHRILIEGVHLIQSMLSVGRLPVAIIVSESAALDPELLQVAVHAKLKPVILSDALFKRLSMTETPTGIAAEVEISVHHPDPAGSQGCVFLDGIQDPGNVGTILRSAAAFGVPDVVLSRGCADPWSPKALRAGMGGHFFLRIAMSSNLADDLRQFGEQSICTAVQGGVPLSAIDLTARTAWVFGGEGGGVSPDVSSQATRKATIAMPGGTESLNVAATAAICFYEQARQISTRAARS